MSNASRIIAPLLALSLATACDSDHDDLDQAEIQADDDGFRTGRTTRGGGSGILFNTNNLGEWVFTELKLDGSFHREVALLGAVNAAFDYSGMRPVWERDDLASPVQIGSDASGALDVHVNALHMLTGTAVDGSFLQHGDFHNSIWRVQIDPAYIADLDAAAVLHNGAGVVDLRLEVGWLYPDGNIPTPPGFSEDSDELHVASHGGIPTYTWYYDKDGEQQSTCTTSLVPGATYEEAVLYNDVVIDENNGEVTFEDDIIQIACLEGAIGKVAASWGYWPDEVDHPGALVAGDIRENFETITRVARADYCGDGTSWTVPGTPLELYDTMLHTPADSVATDYGPLRPAVEAVWAPGGALCLDFPRDLSMGTPSCGIPSCGGKWPSFADLNDPAHPSVYLTRTTRVFVPNI